MSELGRMFLEELACAQRSFELGQGRLRAALDAPEGRHWALALAERDTDVDVLHKVLREQADRAGRLAISEMKVKFWVEPVRASWFRRLLAALHLAPPIREDLVRLASAGRNPRATELLMSIVRLPDGQLRAEGPIPAGPSASEAELGNGQ